MFNAEIYNNLRLKHINAGKEKLNASKEDLNVAMKKETDAMFAVCAYLDSVGMYMPQPKYIYDEIDRTTWKYLNGKVNYGNFLNKFRYKSLFNPSFKYGHLI